MLTSKFGLSSHLKEIRKKPWCFLPSTTFIIYFTLLYLVKKTMEDINLCYNMSCMDFMDSCSSEYFDCIITDPPWTINIDDKINSFKDYKPEGRQSSSFKQYKNDVGQIDDAFIKKMAINFFKVLKSNSYCIICFNSTGFTELKKNMEDAGFIFVQVIYWIKNNTIITQSPYKLFEKIEPFYVFRKGSPMPIPFELKGKGNLFECDIIQGTDKTHPTEKPVKLMKEIIKRYTKPKQIIYDAFAGSGSTLKASKELARNSVGTELMKDYVDLINRELKRIIPIKIEEQQSLSF